MSAAPSLSETDYERFRDLIVERTGLMFGERRRDALARAVVTLAQPDTPPQDYYARLAASPTDSPLWDELVKALTICETYFFRDPDQIEALRRNILPDLIARHWTDHSLRIWSAGCATGEEPYTLALLLREALPDIDRWKISLLATDINKVALAQAARGVYRAWSFRETGPEARQRYFTQQGDDYTLQANVRRMVNFAYLNLAEPSYPSPTNHTADLDLILCRNVTIYLPEPVIRAAAHRFYDCLTPGGWLIVGPSETQLEIYQHFHTLKFGGAIVYQKVAPSAATSLKPAFVWTPPVPAVKPRPVPITTPAPAPAPAPLPVPAADCAALQAQGETLFRQQNLDEARQALLDCLKHDAHNVPVLGLLARLEANAGRLTEAQRWAGLAAERDPLRSETHYLLALLHQAQGETELALKCLKKTLYLDPDFVLAHYTLAMLHEQNGRPAEAARHRGLAVRLAARLAPETILPGSDDLTAGALLSQAQPEGAA